MNEGGEIFAYSGRLVQPGDKPRHDGLVAEPVIAGVDEAHGEAARIIAAAREEAEEIRQKKLAGLDLEFERRIAERLTIAASDFHFGLNECAGIMAHIVEDALRTIIGETRNPEIVAKAIGAAVKRHEGNHVLEVLVSPEDQPRLALLEMGMPRGARGAIRVVSDATVEQGRCILKAGDRRHDISVESQIRAFGISAQRLASTLATDGGEI
ncbi:MAG: hypothetical protein KDJ48_00370 [Nitratireductor sp.]|nr:hypothetical protein [Nitratireductor sp.]